MLNLSMAASLVIPRVCSILGYSSTRQGAHQDRTQSQPASQLLLENVSVTGFEVSRHGDGEHSTSPWSENKEEHKN